MAKLYLYSNKLRHNYRFLERTFKKHLIDWTVVTKLLCGNKKFLEEVLAIHDGPVCDSRISNLKMIKQIRPDAETVYIKPPSKSVIKKLVRYADISLNSELETLKLISREALNQKKTHKVVIMVESGDLREGVLGNELENFYSKAFKLKGIEVLGIGSNLNCLNGVMPSMDKLTQLIMYRQILELKFNRTLPIVSGGTTVTLPLLLTSPTFPKGINHFRVGEALYFGADLFANKVIKNMYPNIFELKAQVIEVAIKPSEPFGEVRENPMGLRRKVDPSKVNKTKMRAIIDVGTLDVLPQFLIPKNKKLKILGASSDMMVIDISNSNHKYPVGSTMSFQLKYMGALSLISSRYIEKEVL